MRTRELHLFSWINTLHRQAGKEGSKFRRMAVQEDGNVGGAQEVWVEAGLLRICPGAVAPVRPPAENLRAPGRPLRPTHARGGKKKATMNRPMSRAWKAMAAGCACRVAVWAGEATCGGDKGRWLLASATPPGRLAAQLSEAGGLPPCFAALLGPARPIGSPRLTGPQNWQEFASAEVVATHQGSELGRWFLRTYYAMCREQNAEIVCDNCAVAGPASHE